MSAGDGEVVGPEGLRQDIGEREPACGRLDDAVFSPVLPQELAATATGHDDVARLVHTYECDQPTSPTGDQFGDQTTLSA